MKYNTICSQLSDLNYEKWTDHSLFFSGDVTFSTIPVLKAKYTTVNKMANRS